MDRKLIEYNSRVRARVERLSSTIESLLIGRMKTMARYFLDKGCEVYYFRPYSACWHEGGLGEIVIKGMSAEDRKACEKFHLDVQDYDSYYGNVLSLIKEEYRDRDFVRITDENIGTIGRML